jgi:ferritin-like metal-binding protein YciE
MANEARDILVVGLRNAHAVESQALEILERQAESLKGYPDVQARIQAHLGETEGQLTRLEQCLEMLDEEPSAMKDTALATLGNFMALANSMSDDAILKNSFASYSFEHYEIAAYESLLELAELTEERDMVPLLQQSLAEERAMANWLGQNVRPMTRQYISRRHVGDQAA